MLLATPLGDFYVLQEMRLRTSVELGELVCQREGHIFSVPLGTGSGCWSQFLHHSPCRNWLLDAIGRQCNGPVVDRKGWQTELSIEFLELVPLIENTAY